MLARLTQKKSIGPELPIALKSLHQKNPSTL